MTIPDTTGAGDDGGQSGVFTRCSRCSIRVRRSEMEIHLAHSHNIGPSTGKKDKGKDGRGKRRRSYDD